MKNVLVFILGAGVGSAVTYKIVEKHFKAIADEEIQSVVDRFKQKEKDLSESILSVSTEEMQSMVDEFKEYDERKKIEKEAIDDIINEAKKITNKYNNPDAQNEDTPQGDVESDDDLYVAEDPVDEEDLDNVEFPFVITSDDYGTFEYYGTKILYYYKDDVLTNEVDDVIPDKTGWLGPEILKNLRNGSYIGTDQLEGDSLYVRDNINEMDFEIILMDKKFSEIPEEEVQ